jgi:excinuclease ABC subunit A
LDYLHLGQPSSTLSGGEAQRIKLARELSKVATGKTFYILDEPTTGLHFDDVRKLLVVLNRLVDAGNSVTVIEHNLDVIKTADWVIDIGPDGGPKGGKIVGQGTPEQVSKIKASETGRYLLPLLKQRKPVSKAKMPTPTAAPALPPAKERKEPKAKATKPATKRDVPKRKAKAKVS